jgi:hypothetical protein
MVPESAFDAFSAGSTVCLADIQSRLVVDTLSLELIESPALSKPASVTVLDAEQALNPA